MLQVIPFLAFQELIQFPVLKMNAETLEIESEFSEFVKPRTSPILSDKCKKLTGITQVGLKLRSLALVWVLSSLLHIRSPTG